MVEIRMLGALEVIVEGVPHAFAAPPRTLPLFGYLMLARGRQVPRDEVAFLLWPDAPEDDARADLRRHLYYLSKALPPAGERPWFHADKKFVAWDGEGRATFDVTQFEALLRDDAALERAMALYRGPLLAGVDDEWIEQERTRLERLALDALQHAIERARESDPARAIDAARQMLRIDPWREDALRASLEARARGGDRAGALAEYREFEKRLRAELDVAPMPETRALYDRIAGGEIAVAVAAAAGASRAGFVRANGTAPLAADGVAVAGSAVLVAARGAVRSGRRGNVPPAATPLFGRESVLEEIASLLDASHVIALIGASGVGKTAIALEAARRAADRFPGGVWVADLSTCASPGAVAETIARAIDRMPIGGTVTFESLAAALGDEAVLLVLDNCEGAIDSAARAMQTFAERCPGVRVIAGSRERANVAGEAVVNVAPLDRSAGIALFVERVRRTHPAFALDGASEETIAEIVTQLDGLALAIELAAARVATLGVAGVAARLGERMRLLIGGDRSAPGHHRTMRAAIEWSYQALDPDERLAFDALGLHGTWSPDGIAPYLEAIGLGERCEELVESLCAKSLVVVEARDGAVRHAMLETLRAFARERLAERADGARIVDAYVASVASIAASLAAARASLDDAAWLARARAEWPNVRDALAILSSRFDVLDESERSRTVAARIIDDVGPAWRHLASTADRALAADLLARFGRAGSDAQGASLDRALVAALAVVVAEGAEPGDAARVAGAQAFSLARTCGDRTILASALGVFGEALLAAGRHAEASAIFDEALGIVIAAGRSREIGLALVRRASAALRGGDLLSAGHDFERAAVAARESGATIAAARASRGLAILAFAAGNVARAREHAFSAEAGFVQMGLSNEAGWIEADLAAFAIAEGNLAAARAAVTAAHAAGRRSGDAALERTALERMAVVLGLEGAFSRGVRLLGYVDSKRWELGASLDTLDRPGYDRLIAVLTAALPQPELLTLGAEGASLSAADAERLAFADRAAVVP